MFVYKITNTVNGKMYIGLTTCTVAKRWREHLSAARRGECDYPLYRAMRKYGLAAFKIKTVYEAVDERELQMVEKGLIAQYGTMFVANGYNLTAGGESAEGRIAARGEDAGAARITEEIVKFIRDPANAEIANGALVGIVAEKFGKSVSRDCLRDARRGDGWNHLDKSHPPIRTGQGSRQSAEGLQRMRENGLRSAASGQLKQAVEASRAVTRGNKWTAKLTTAQVQAIYVDPRGCWLMAKEYGVSRDTVKLIRARKTWQRETEGLPQRVKLKARNTPA